VSISQPFKEESNKIKSMRKIQEDDTDGSQDHSKSVPAGLVGVPSPDRTSREERNSFRLRGESAIVSRQSAKQEEEETREIDSSAQRVTGNEWRDWMQKYDMDEYCIDMMELGKQSGGKLRACLSVSVVSSMLRQTAHLASPSNNNPLLHPPSLVHQASLYFL
jgi:hypothetical protein